MHAIGPFFWLASILPENLAPRFCVLQHFSIYHNADYQIYTYYCLIISDSFNLLHTFNSSEFSYECFKLGDVINHHH